MRIYVASSWRNERQPGVVSALRWADHEVYDFKVDGGFSWNQIHPEWATWTMPQYLSALGHPLAEAGYATDMEALAACDAVVLVNPCGRSAHLEFGWAIGAGKLGVILLNEGDESDLMYKMADRIVTSITEVVGAIGNFETEGKGLSR